MKTLSNQPATTIHRHTDVGIPQGVGEGKADELRAWIGVEDLRLAEAGDRRPHQNLPTEPVHDRDQVQEASAHRYVGHVCAPDPSPGLNG
jgi:hypothetical protein